MEHTQLRKPNMNLSHSPQIQMNLWVVYVCIVYMTTRKEDGRALVKDKMKDAIVLLLMLTSKSEQCELWLCLHTAFVFIGGLRE